MPSLFPLGPTHPDTNIISIYTHAQLSVLLLPRTRLPQGRSVATAARYGPAGTLGDLVAFSEGAAGKYTFNAKEAAGGRRQRAES